MPLTLETMRNHWQDKDGGEVLQWCCLQRELTPVSRESGACRHSHSTVEGNERTLEDGRLKETLRTSSPVSDCSSYYDVHCCQYLPYDCTRPRLFLSRVFKGLFCTEKGWRCVYIVMCIHRDNPISSQLMCNIIDLYMRTQYVDELNV